MSMSSTAPAPYAPIIEISPGEEKAIRRQARRRASYCPGAGWALLGYPQRGKTVLLCVALCLISAVWLLLTLSTASIWAAAATMLIALLAWSAELFDVGRCVVRSPADSFLVHRRTIPTMLVYGVVAFTPLLVLVSFGEIKIDDDRMAPAIEPGEHLIYHRHVSDRELKPGAIILYRLPPHARGGMPGELVVARILAAPDDELTIRDGHYVVNGQVSRNQPPGKIRKAPLSVPGYPRKLIVPPARYFIVQDSPATGLDSQQLDYVRRIDIVSARLFHFGARGLMRPMD
jgi:signal peptidase I